MSPALFASSGVTLEYAYCMGYDAGINGPNMQNTHFSIFSKPEFTKEWERGKKLGDQHRRDAAEGEQKK